MSDKNAPIYVKIDDYEDIINVFSFIKKNISDAKVLLNKIAELKSQEDMELENWYSEVTDIESKIKFIDETLFDFQR